MRLDAKLDAIERVVEEAIAQSDIERQYAQRIGEAVRLGFALGSGQNPIDALIRSRDDALCADCGHKVSEHGPEGCEVQVAGFIGEGDEAQEISDVCGCTSWTTEFDKEAHEGRYGK